MKYTFKIIHVEPRTDEKIVLMHNHENCGDVIKSFCGFLIAITFQRSSIVSALREVADELDDQSN